MQGGVSGTLNIVEMMCDTERVSFIFVPTECHLAIGPVIWTNSGPIDVSYGKMVQIFV